MSMADPVTISYANELGNYLASTTCHHNWLWPVIPTMPGPETNETDVILSSSYILIIIHLEQSHCFYFCLLCESVETNKQTRGREDEAALLPQWISHSKKVW